MYDKEIVARLKAKNLTVFEEVYQLRLEVVKGCNLNCPFCGRSRLDQGIMEKELYKKILNDLTPRIKRIELAAQGEPSLHPELNEFISIAREKFEDVQLLIYTNSEIYRRKGTGIKELFKLYESGINLIQVDLYNEKQKNWFYSQLKDNDPGVLVYDFYKDKVSPWSYKGKNNKFLIIADETKGFNHYSQKTREAHTFGGNLEYREWKEYIGKDYKDFPLQKTCVEPLKYMTIGYNGDVYLCCTDGAKSIVIDNVRYAKVNEVWQSNNMQVLRQVLKLGHRGMIPCCILCNVNSVRPGLYPYWGKVNSLKHAIETIIKISNINKEEPLYNNLMEYSKEFELERHIMQLLGEK